jgi:hypothetical protein
MKKIHRQIWFSMLYTLCLCFLFPVAWNIFRPPVSSAFWLDILKFSGPALIYLGLVLQRTRKPIPITRKVAGVIIFLIGFAWFFTWLQDHT